MKLKKHVAISDSGFLFNATTGDSYSLNPIAAEIIKLYQQGHDDQTIIEYLVDNYTVDRNTAEKDLQDFCERLIHYKLVE
ncbi:MAG: PqqD family protein [Chitinophagales bacterium]|nr:PqqD family protein [Chitinophagales bacterium]